MRKIFAKLQAYTLDTEGATAIEYGLIAGGISLAIVAGVFAFGDNLEALFDSLGTAMGEAQTGIDGADFNPDAAT